MFNWFGLQVQSGDQRWLKAWEKRRRMGFLGFVLVWGFGQFGVLSWLLFTLVMCGMIWVWDGPSVIQEKIGKVLMTGGLLIPAGVLSGVWIWFATEKRYKRMMKEVGREPTPPGTGDPDAG